MSDHLSDLPDHESVLRALPHAVGPEKSILSSMLSDPREFIGLAIEERFTPAHFYLPAHSTLFAFLVELSEAGQEIELVSLVEKLRIRGILDRVGGPANVTDLYTYAPTGGHFRHHLQMVRDAFVLREVLAAASEASGAVYDAPEDVDALLDGVEARIMAIRESRQSAGSDSIRPDVAAAVRRLEDRIDGKQVEMGIATGFEDLDRLTSGLKPGEVFVVAARPSMGKTSLMMNIVEHVAIDQAKPTMVFSLEMSRGQLVDRSIYSRARINPRTFLSPNKGELQRFQRAAVELNNAPLFIDDRPGITINELRAKARRRKRESGLELIAIDYLQLMRSNSKQAQGSREREIAEISAGIKGLAKELGVPIILLAQLNRDVEKRTGKGHGVPRMSDLRESGSIEQDADYIAFLTRPERYADDDAKESLEGVADLLLEKNRNGETGKIPLTFIAQLMRFESGQPRAEQLAAPKSRHDFFD